MGLILAGSNRGVDQKITQARLGNFPISCLSQFWHREELLNQYLFMSLDDVREATYWWRIEYNEERPMMRQEIEPRSRRETRPETLLVQCRDNGEAYVIFLAPLNILVGNWTSNSSPICR